MDNLPSFVWPIVVSYVLAAGFAYSMLKAVKLYRRENKCTKPSNTQLWLGAFVMSMCISLWLLYRVFNLPLEHALIYSFICGGGYPLIVNRMFKRAKEKNEEKYNTMRVPYRRDYDKEYDEANGSEDKGFSFLDTTTWW